MTIDLNDFRNLDDQTTKGRAILALLAELTGVNANVGKGALLQGAAGQSIPNNVLTPLDFDIGPRTIRYEDDGPWYSVVTPTVLIIPVALRSVTQRVQVWGRVEWAINTVGVRTIVETTQPIGGLELTINPVAGVVTRMGAISAPRDTLGIINTYELLVLQTSGAPLVISKAEFAVWITRG